MMHPNESKILTNLYRLINEKVCVWVGETINSEEYKEKLVIENWVCIYEQMIAEKTVNGSKVYFE